MGKTIRKYQIKDRNQRYKRKDREQYDDKYYTDVSKSHDRKIKRKRIEDNLEDY
jgi:hypothetical protein